ncbi:uncharacterized protein KY384_007093 [Bacidia gigantensis]|uniref:uncharacterized protein n=1 Tax=Bacidia gigantensis TaxID=2732470 RepID=UPI001D05565C|nr:uncharacterized protein KY384_007093 [Bacidia gigantensis]KAG8528176.1 hypothetical protein KY384_007093 [Bacidia gigantensis]
MDLNGEVRHKRKSSPVHIKDRPSKIRKPDNDFVNGSTSIENDHDSSTLIQTMESEIVQQPVTALADSVEWQATIEKVVKKVVSIHFCQTCSFDTDAAIASEATGFVVDATRGYILTNRHVVGAGPFWGYCIFDNHEECAVRPIYRDPVHDFGILQFDPKEIKYLELSEIQLRPDLAKVGSEIRVVGNDAGEKLSILSGVISRLDRNAPEYGEGYSDFNTNYIQAAAAASGGSSGSPVVNRDGHAVALQAGGRSDGAATDYFLPLDRPLRVLKCIQDKTLVSRGTIQTQWLIKPFDECRRLGLTSEHEAAIRKNFPKETGLLVAEIVLPEGPADGKLEEGDVLIKVNDEFLTQFVRLDDILDSSVGSQVKLMVQRGGHDIEVEVDVGDLHAITPDRFVSVTGASFHDLSYQQARLYAIPVKGVFVCEAAGTFRFEGSESGWMIESVDGHKTPNLETFVEVMKGVADRARVVVTYKHLRDLHTTNTSIMYIDRHWHTKIRMAVRNDETGLWDFQNISDPLPAVQPVRRRAEFPRLDTMGHEAATDAIRSFVRVSCTMPIKLDGFPRTRRIGHGLVINAEKGLVIVSRATIPYDMCDISCTIADNMIVEAKVVFMHPIANYAIIQYDASLVDAPVKSAKLAQEPIKQGASTIFLGWNQNLRAVVTPTTVTDITTVAIPSNPQAPRYRAINLDAITVDTGLSGQCGSGALVAEDGTIEALWLSYLGERSGGVQIEKDIAPKLRILNIETNTIQMSQARIMGVTSEWVDKVSAANPTRHQLFMVRKVDCASPTDKEDEAFKEGDIILTLNDHLITSVSQFDIMYDHDSLDALIVRNKELMQLRVPTIPTEDLETDRAIIFCGAIIHRPHHAVRQQISKLHSEVYVSARTRGSPAYQYGLAPTNFITHVNDKRTATLTEFLDAVNSIPDNTYFRLRASTFDNVPWVATMKKNEHYFPTMEYSKDAKEPNGWKVQKWAEKGGAEDTAGGLMDEGGGGDGGEDGGETGE